MIFEDNPSTVRIKAPKSSIDYHDYMLELELPDDLKDTKEICVKERGGKFTIDFDCTHGEMSELKE